ncbi:MAG: TonB-dependent receptor [Halieaceae bacterium]|nr:TonB-dependent receptor [Halieaceae bacterium]
MKIRFKCLTLPLAVMAASSSTQLLAQQVTLEEVIVTAQKRVESLQDVPISVVAVSGDTIDEQGIFDLEQLSFTMPNITITQEQISDRISIRGIASGGNQGFDQSVGLFSNGVYMGRGTQFRSAFLDVSSIEILRGPQATLFGKNTIAGAVNITSRRPDQEFGAEIRASYEIEYDDWSTTGFVTGGLTDNLAGRLAFKVKKGNGFVENKLLNRDEADAEADNYRLSLLWDPSENLSVNFSYEAYSQELNGKGFEIVGDEDITILPGSTVENPKYIASSQCRAIFVDCKLNHQLYGTNVDGTPFFDREEYSELDTELAALSIEYQLGEYTINSVTGYTSSDLFEVNPTAAVAIPTSNNFQEEEYESFSQELRITSPTGSTIEWLAGLYFESGDYEMLETINLNDTAVFGGTIGTNVQIKTDFEQEAETYAIFGQGTWNITDEFRATFGLRYSEEEKKAPQTYTLNDAARGIRLAGYFSDIAGLGPVIGEAAAADLAAAFNLEEHNIPRQTYEQEDWSPSVNLQLDVNPDVLLYASWSIGYKSGGFDARIATDGVSDGIIDAEAYAEAFEFDQEKATTYELGFKTALAQGAAELNGAFFYTQYEDLQFSAFNGGLSFLVDNAADVDLTGFELEGRWQLTENLMLSGGGSWLDYEYQEFKNAPCDVYATLSATTAGCVTDLSGETGVNTPEYSANVTLDWKRAISSDIELQLGATLLYEDSFFVATDLDPLLEQDSYTKLNLRARLNSLNNTWSTALLVNNVTDEDTFHYGNDVPLFSGARFIRPDAPRTVTLEVVYRFN